MNDPWDDDGKIYHGEPYGCFGCLLALGALLAAWVVAAIIISQFYY